MKRNTTIPAWINIAPTEDETSRNEDGSVFMPIGIVEPKLTKLDPHWGTERFRFQTIQITPQRILIDGSLEIVITYGSITRRLTGAATMIVELFELDDPDFNSNFSATIKSECIKNGVKAIGLAFGAGLNDRLVVNYREDRPKGVSSRKPLPVDMIPDAKMRANYAAAVKANNAQAVNAIKAVYPNIDQFIVNKQTPDA